MHKDVMNSLYIYVDFVSVKFMCLHNLKILARRNVFNFRFTSNILYTACKYINNLCT